MAYLRLTVNKKDEEALRRVINYPKRGIGDTSVDKIAQAAADKGITMWEILPLLPLPGRTKTAIEDFVLMIEEFSKKALVWDAWKVADFVAHRTGILDELKHDKTVEGAARLDNVTSLLDGIKTFVEDDEVNGGRLAAPTTEVEGDDDGFPPVIDPTDKSLAAYLQNIALMSDLDNADNDGNYVTLMSVHSAKGLEFKSVFVSGMEEQLFPSFMSQDSPDGLDEERRLFYVAITRAEQALTLSFARTRFRHGQERSNPPSRFLKEIDESHLDISTPISGQSRSQESFDRQRFGGNSEPVRQTSGVSGNFKSRGPQPMPMRIDPANFKPSQPASIQVGMKVLHLKFGEGKVLAVDGALDKRVAKIIFPELEADNEKTIMLKFAKLQIVE